MPELAAHGLPILDELGDQLLAGYRRDRRRAERARRAPRGRARRRRGGGLSLLFAALLLLAAAAAAGAATYYVLHASPIAPFAAQDVPAEQRVAPGTSHVLALRAKDPAGAPAWTLRLARSDTGLVCGTVGQVVGGEFGLVGLDHRFRAVPEINADACGQSSRDGVALLGTRVFDATRYGDVRTVINGVAGSDLAQVLVGLRGRAPRPVAHDGDGAFLVAATGYPEDLQPVVVLRWSDGHTRRVALAASPSVVADPLGGRAWRAELFSGGRHLRTVTEPNGRHVKVPVYSCVSFFTARWQKSGVARSPAACGFAHSYPAPDRSLFFTTRRLSGGRRIEDGTRIGGAWNRHAPRTALWGAIGRAQAREIVITAPGIRRTLRPTFNGLLLVVLPPSVDPARVRVELRLAGGAVRRLGPSFGLVDPKVAF